jgi:hypothetical protein
MNMTKEPIAPPDSVYDPPPEKIAENDPLPWFATEARSERLPDTASREAPPGPGPLMEALSEVEKRLAGLIERIEQTESSLDALADDMTNRVGLLERYKSSIVDSAVGVGQLNEKIELLATQVSAQLSKGVGSQSVSRRDARRPAFGRWTSVRVTLGVLMLISVVIMRSTAGTDRPSLRSRATRESSAPSTSTPPSIPPASATSVQPVPTTGGDPAKPPLVPTTGEDPAKPPLRSAPARPPEFVGTLVLQSDPRGAAVLIDGRPVGRTPLQLARVRAGSHAVWVEREGYQRWTASIRVPAEKSTPVNVKLEVQGK